MSIIIEEIKAISNLDLMPKQKKFYLDLLEVAKPVEVVSIKEVFDKIDISLIKKAINPRKKECYKNAHLLSTLFPDVKYCEGKANFSFSGLHNINFDHAFNLVGDKYIDITVELALKEFGKYQYVLFGEYSLEEIERVSEITGYYGEYFKHIYLENLL